MGLIRYFNFKEANARADTIEAYWQGMDDCLSCIILTDKDAQRLSDRFMQGALPGLDDRKHVVEVKLRFIETVLLGLVRNNGK